VSSTTTRSSAALALLLCGACNSDPYVVASARDDGLTNIQNVVSDCEEGSYEGWFSTIEMAGNLPLELSGALSFSLVKSERGGEFLRLGDTKLEGTDPNPARPSRFSAVIETGECKEGSYTTDITHGEFVFLLPDGGVPAGEPAKFTGQISGEYVLKEHTFYGKWNTITPLGLPIGGRWAAFLK
jgi:hypothetical protein